MNRALTYQRNKFEGDDFAHCIDTVGSFKCEVRMKKGHSSHRDDS